jgi:hypothetical protein
MLRGRLTDRRFTMIRKGMKFDTGNYLVTVGEKFEDGERQLFVKYTGPDGGGKRVECSWDERTEIEFWGDFDVETLLEEYGFDRFTNKRRG